jgi:hypothetical protein
MWGIPGNFDECLLSTLLGRLASAYIINSFSIENASPVDDLDQEMPN